MISKKFSSSMLILHKCIIFSASIEVSQAKALKWLVYTAIQGRTWNVGKEEGKVTCSWGNSAECKENKQTQSLEKENRLKWLEQEWWTGSQVICDVSWVPGPGLGGCFRSKHWAERELVWLLKSNHLPQQIRILHGTLFHDKIKLRKNTFCYCS